MESFYTNIKSIVTNVYNSPVKSYRIYISCNAYWAQYKIDGGSWEYYGPDGKVLNLQAGNHIFTFRGTAGWAAPVDFTYNVQSNKKIYVIYKQSYNILMDHLENFQIGDIFYATKS